MKRTILTLVLLIISVAQAVAGSCPKIVGAKEGGRYPHLFERLEFEEKYSCHLSLKTNPEIAVLNRKIAGNKSLPELDKRVPQEPLVIVPYEQIGQYGGVFNGISKATESGTSDLLSVRHVNLVRYNDDLTKIVPNVAKSWEFNPDYTELTLHLRAGHKWSDGVPFTAADIAYWYNNLVLDPKVIKKPKGRFLSAGEPWKVEALDAQRVRITTKAPQPGLLSMFATDFAQPFQPKHLLAQFDPKENKDADKLAQELGFKDGYEALIFYYGQSDWKDIPTPINKNRAQSDNMVAQGYPATAPTLESFIVVEDTPEGRRLVANPYFFQVDTAGNQLPYINEIKETFIGDEDIQTAKMIAGEVSYKAQAVNLPAAPVLLENRRKGKYNIALRPNVALTSFSFNVNDKDEELRKIFSDLRFRKAASLALNREKMNEVAFLKLGKPTQYTVFDADTTSFVTEQQRGYLTQYNPEKSKELLAQIGLQDSNADGVLELPSGKKFELVLQYTTQGIATELAEIFAQNMSDVGVKVSIKEVTSDEYRNSQSANELHIMEWQTGQPLAVMASNVENLKPPFGNFFDLRNGLDWMKYNDSRGKEGIKPPPAITEIGTLADKFTTLQVGTDASNKLGQKIIDKWLQQLLVIGTVKGVSPIYYHNSLGNFTLPKTSSYEYYRVYPYIPTQWFIKH